MLIAVVLAVPASYGIAKYRYRGRKLMLLFFLVTQMLPVSVLLTPMFIMFKGMHVYNTWWSAILADATIGIPFSVLILKNYFASIPKELEEAAYIDGAGFIRTFTGIVLPSAGPGILTVGVLSYVWCWNDAHYVKLFDNTNVKFLMLAFNKATGSVDEALASISSKVPVNYAFLLKSPVYEAAIAKTAALLVFLPLVILYLIVQRRFVQGVERSGIVG